MIACLRDPDTGRIRRFTLDGLTPVLKVAHRIPPSIRWLRSEPMVDLCEPPKIKVDMFIPLRQYRHEVTDELVLVLYRWQGTETEC